MSHVYVCSWTNSRESLTVLFQFRVKRSLPFQFKVTSDSFSTTKSINGGGAARINDFGNVSATDLVDTPAPATAVKKTQHFIFIYLILGNNLELPFLCVFQSTCGTILSVAILSWREELTRAVEVNLYLKWTNIINI